MIVPVGYSSRFSRCMPVFDSFPNCSSRTVELTIGVIMWRQRGASVSKDCVPCHPDENARVFRRLREVGGLVEPPSFHDRRMTCTLVLKRPQVVERVVADPDEAGASDRRKSAASIEDRFDRSPSRFSIRASTNVARWRKSKGRSSSLRIKSFWIESSCIQAGRPLAEPISTLASSTSANVRRLVRRSP